MPMGPQYQGGVLTISPWRRPCRITLAFLDEKDKDTFRKAAKTINEANLLERVRKYDDEHKQSSSFRPQADKIGHFLTVLDRFMAGVEIGIQASSDISSIVVGGIRVVLDVVVRFVAYFENLTSMLCQFEDWLRPLQEYCRTTVNDLVVIAAAQIYTDLLRFSTKAYSIFANSDGQPKRAVTTRAFFRVQWRDFKDDFADIQRDVIHHLNVLLHSATAQQINTMKAMMQRVEAVARTQEDGRSNARTETRRQFLIWLSNNNKIDFEKAHDILSAKRHPGTGEWLLKTWQFRDWFGSPKSSLLWCYGKPGAGKSVLASNILDYISTSTHSALADGITFAYYDYQNNEMKDSSLVIAALIKQLCQRLDTVPDWLKDAFNKDSSPSTIASLDSYRQVAKRFGKVFLVVDALDECERAGREQILDFLTGVITTVPCAKVFVTSRKESDITNAFENMTTPVIEIKTDDVSPDIRRFVTDRVAEFRQSRRLNVKNEDLAAKIVKTLSDQAEGMFLYVNLQLDHMCEVSDENPLLIERELARLPQGLYGTYDRIIGQIEKRSEYIRELARSCFVWVIYAQRQLHKEEFRHAVAASVADWRNMPTPLKNRSSWL